MADSRFDVIVTALAGSSRRRLLGALIAGVIAARFTGTADVLGKRRKKPRPTVKRDAWCANHPEVKPLPAPGDRRFAQVFEARRKGKLVRADVRVRKTEGSTGDWFVGMLEVDLARLPVDPALVETRIADSEVRAGDVFLRAVFSPAVPVRESKEYAVFVTRPDSEDDLNPLNRIDNPCGGRLYSKRPGDDPYVPTTTPRDLVYTTFVKA